MTKREQTNKQLAKEREDLTVEIARLRGALRAIEKVANLNLSTPVYTRVMDRK